MPPTLPLPELVISALKTALDVVAPPTVFTSLNVSIGSTTSAYFTMFSLTSGSINGVVILLLGAKLCTGWN